MSTTEQIVIAGGGIGGLVLALTLHEIGVSCTVVETSNSMRPLGARPFPYAAIQACS